MKAVLTPEERKQHARNHARSYRLRNPDKVHAYARAWRLAHPEYYREMGRLWRLRNQTRARELLQIWRLSHVEEVKAIQRKRYLAHSEVLKKKNSVRGKIYRLAYPERERARGKAKRIANPEAELVRVQRRRARKAGLPNTLTVAEWRAICAAYKNRCAYCGKKRKLTQDHVLPLSKGGGTVANNIIPACRSCNARKGASLPHQPIKLVLALGDA